MDSFSGLGFECSPSFRPRSGSTTVPSSSSADHESSIFTLRSPSPSSLSSASHISPPTSIGSSSPLTRPCLSEVLFPPQPDNLYFSATTSSQALQSTLSSGSTVRSSTPTAFITSPYRIQDSSFAQTETKAPSTTSISVSQLTSTSKSPAPTTKMSTIGYSLPSPFRAFGSHYPYTAPSLHTFQEDPFSHVPLVPSQGAPENVNGSTLSSAFVPSASSSPSAGNMSVEEREIARQRRRHSQATTRVTKFRRDKSPNNVLQRPGSRQEMALAMAVSSATLTPPLTSAPSNGTRFPVSYYPLPMSTSELFDPLISPSHSYASNAYTNHSDHPSLAPYQTWSQNGIAPQNISPDSISQRPYAPIVSNDAHLRHPNEPHVRVVGSRPKPQCWDHGCNGRQFSTFSNLLRHQREKSGTAAKSECPRCGAVFTRSTARNGHMAHDKCKSRKSTTTNS